MDAILHLMQRETTCAYAALHVKALNTAAVTFYERHGFECDPLNGVLRRHYWIDNECAPPSAPITHMMRDDEPCITQQ